jgi:hypothetical protein
MSVIVGNGVWISYNETDIKCPICTFEFDASEKIEKAKYPVFRTKCPACKGKIGISVPLFGGNTKCFEWIAPKTTKDNRLRTETEFKVNGEIVVKY